MALSGQRGSGYTDRMSILLAAAFACISPVAVDGDTLRCGQVGSVRLLSIDAPELPGHCRRGRRCTPGDPFASTRSLVQLLQRRPVICKATARDDYGRVLAWCSAGGVDLSCAQVTRGMAVVRYGRLTCPR